MGYEYPIVLVVGFALLAVALFLSFFIKGKKKKGYVKGKKVANTQYIKESEIYKKLLVEYKAGIIIVRSMFVVILGASVIMLAQPYEYKVSKTTLKTRDIYLCMDASSSVDALNEGLADQFIKNTWQLEGEQFGITIFNSSSIVLVPLTTDYNCVNSSFEKLKESFGLRKREEAEGGILSEDSDKIRSYIENGTIVGAEEKGSSLVGEGLASCVYDFPDNEDGSRTQIIILTTDNDPRPDDKEVIDITGAAQIAAEKGITIYGIAPTEFDGMEINPEYLEKMKAAVELTGGSFYTANDSNAVKSVLEDIQKQEGSDIDITKNYKQVNIFVPFILFLFGITVMTLVRKKVTG